MRRVASEFGGGLLSSRLYQSRGQYSWTTARRRFGSWNTALQAAGLSLRNEIDISDEKLFENVYDLWVRLGRQPRKRELVPPLSCYSERPYARRFGSWRMALTAFVAWADADSTRPVPTAIPSSTSRRRTNRDPDMSLRFRVMRGDNFACRCCGRSPARDPAVELHVDYVTRWLRSRYVPAGS
jgi:hypothetical protein